MIKRLSIISTAVLAALLIAGLAWATPDDSSSSSSSTTSTTLAVNTTAASQTATGSATYEAGAAGQVTVDRTGTALSISNVAANTNWSHEVEVAAGREVEVKFVNGTERIDFQAELEDGIVKTRVRTRTLDGSADDSSDSDNSADDNQASTAPSDGALSFNADRAGTVQLRATDGSLELVNATPNDGWTVADIEIEGSREINVEFRNGAIEIEFKAEMEDGMIKTRVRTEMDDDSGTDDSKDDSSGRSDDEDDSTDDDDSSRSDDQDSSGPSNDNDNDNDNSIDD